MPGNGPALLGMPAYEYLQLLTTNCQMANDPHKGRKINMQTKQEKSKPNNSTKNNPHANNKTNQKMEYLNLLQGRHGSQQRGDYKNTVKNAQRIWQHVYWN